MFPPLYPILDISADARAILPLAETLAGAGASLLQIRAKRAPARAVFELARDLCAQLGPRGVRLIVNDRPDVAVLAGAAGVHVGQEDLPVEEARKICGSDLWVGVSTHNIEQFRRAEATSADYIAVGPVFPTDSKENPDPVVGLDLLRWARANTKKPLVAIGGITVESAEHVFLAGADAVAVIRDLTAAADPAARAREYLKIAARVRASRS
ncbi:MAG TPA: thiamine phosphate synthase [Verrucomicrobiae bacterium]|nr:thiamine phosphate synthase [Verrucomicrobiae bacterium]